MSSTLYALQLDGTCSSQTSVRTISLTTSINIRAGVGNASPPRCQNYQSDVVKIQTALNQFSPLEGGPLISLVSDGIFGPHTKEAIYHFQQKWGIKPEGWKTSDGIVDPEGNTIRRLRKGPGNGQQNLPLEFAGRIPRVMQIITATKAALTVAKTFYALPQSNLSGLNLFSKSAADRLNRHFHLDKLNNPLLRLEEIEQVYNDMLTAIGYIPQGVILAADEPLNMARGVRMFTFGGGYHRRSQGDTWKGISTGSIYICPKARVLNSEGFAYCMIHELAHYVSSISSDIRDVAYFSKTSINAYRNLKPDEAYHNADSYGQYSFEVIGKPDFDVDNNSN